jgi:hypothetical protein
VIAKKNQRKKKGGKGKKKQRKDKKATSVLLPINSFLTIFSPENTLETSSYTC